jgi:hypothetical protein
MLRWSPVNQKQLNLRANDKKDSQCAVVKTEPPRHRCRGGT